MGPFDPGIFGHRERSLCLASVRLRFDGAIIPGVQLVDQLRLGVLRTAPKAISTAAMHTASPVAVNCIRVQLHDLQVGVAYRERQVPDPCRRTVCGMHLELGSRRSRCSERGAVRARAFVPDVSWDRLMADCPKYQSPRYYELTRALGVLSGCMGLGKTVR